MTAEQQMVFVVSLFMFTACSSIEGRYTPDCTAYAGNRITLEDGRFVWEKFTDTVIVSDAGEVVDQFPDYPMRGRYRVDGQTVYFEPETGDAPAPLHLRQEDERVFLLTKSQNESWLNAGERPRCPLVLGREAV